MYKYDISKVCKPFTQDQLVEGRLYLCIYYANTSLKIPFIQYLLYKYNDGPLKHNLIIPFIEYTTEHSLENQLRLFFSKVLEYSIEGESIEIKGLLEKQYLFIDISTFMLKYKEPLGILTESRDCWWLTTLYEIVHLKYIYQYHVDESVTELFIQYPELMKMTHKTKEVESPIVVYNGYTYNRALFVSIFGKNKSFSNGRYGTFYYFTDYEGAIYFIKETISSRNPDRVGIVRSVLFAQKKHVVLNNPSEKAKDLSHIASLTTIQKERLSRVYDPYGEWAKDYTTLFAYKPILSNGRSLDEPLVIVSSINELTTVLNWVEIDKTKLFKKESTHDKYYIK